MSFNMFSYKLFSYIVAVSFIGVGNRSTWRRPPNCRKSLTNLSHNSYNDKMSTHQVIMHQKAEGRETEQKIKM
jgi:hypothetical protein